MGQASAVNCRTGGSGSVCRLTPSHRHLPPPPPPPVTLRCVSSWGQRLLPHQHYPAPLPGGGKAAGHVAPSAAPGRGSGGGGGAQRGVTGSPSKPGTSVGSTLRRAVLSGAALDPLVAAQWAAFSHAWDALVCMCAGDRRGSGSTAAGGEEGGTRLCAGEGAPFWRLQWRRTRIHNAAISATCFRACSSPSPTTQTQDSIHTFAPRSA